MQKIEVLRHESHDKDYVAKWFCKAEDYINSEDHSLSFADAPLLCTLATTLKSFVAIVAKGANLQDVANVMCTHKRKLCGEAIEFLHYNHNLMRWEHMHDLDAHMAEGREEYMLWKHTQRPLSLETFTIHLMELYMGDGLTTKGVKEDMTSPTFHYNLSLPFLRSCPILAHPTIFPYREILTKYG